MSSLNVPPSSSAWTCASAAVYPMKSVSSRSMMRCLRTTLRARSVPAGREDRFLVLAALDETLGLEPLQHLAGRRARDAEHLGDAGGDRLRRAGRAGAVLPDREREEVDRLEVLVDAVSGRHAGDRSLALSVRCALHEYDADARPRRDRRLHDLPRPAARPRRRRLAGDARRADGLRDRHPALPALGRARRTASSRSRSRVEGHHWSRFAELRAAARRRPCASA